MNIFAEKKRVPARLLISKLSLFVQLFSHKKLETASIGGGN